ncbi:hypothetical protein ABZ897_55965 [Nonomuraea sp. NPDC046802]|uniref:hypothetical protein n=1 Tax=Nonomuraea sp. NPDC046802 TaxID=3154919 RepID=UPI0033E98079
MTKQTIFEWLLTAIKARRYIASAGGAGATLLRRSMPRLLTGGCMTDKSDSEATRWGLWLGLAASVISILGWFGVSNWNDFKAWAKGGGEASPQATAGSGTTVAPASTPEPAPTPERAEPVSTPEPSEPVSSSPSVDPGCGAYAQVVASFNASQEGRSNPVPYEQSPVLAIEYRVFANDLDRAASDSEDPELESAIRAVATDARAIADAYYAYNAYNAYTFRPLVNKYLLDAKQTQLICKRQLNP